MIDAEQTPLDPADTFAGKGIAYQEKTLQACLQDPLFADQMYDVLKPAFFDVLYLQEIAQKFFDHKRKFKTFPSQDVLEVIVTKDQDIESELAIQVRDYLKRCVEHPLNGDTGYIQSSSLDFCRKQTVKGAMIKAIDMMQESKYDEIAGVIKEALAAGNSRDLGHDYIEGFASRSEKTIRKPVASGWGVLDKVLNGGWERGTLSTFIAPTGAGKSMFLVNCGASALENGLNVLYVTLEMADFKIGLRFDSYYSGVEINSIPQFKDKVEQMSRERAHGRLFIKEFGTKQASVQTIRSYIQRLQSTKDFTPDVLVLDYADLLRGGRGYADKRFELEGNYEDLRGLAQEFNMVVLTADQTNRSGLDMEIVSIGQIGESYAKATVCDLIMTVSRTMEDKQRNTGRLFVAKSRLGRDGMIFPFILNTSTVKVRMLEENISLEELMMAEGERAKERLGDKLNKFLSTRKTGSEG